MDEKSSNFLLLMENVVGLKERLVSSLEEK